MKYPNLELGTIEAVFNKLGGEKGAQGFLRGDVVIVVKRHIIDLDTDPFVPEGWTVEEHRKGGQFAWDPEAVALHLSPNRQSGKVIKGKMLRLELANQPVLNANALDYLLKNPTLIPEDWKGKYVFFWGTIYRGSGGRLYARYLDWSGERWDWDYCWLGDDWSVSNPAAVCAR